MDSFQQPSVRFCSSVESPLSVNSQREKPADFLNESSFGTSQRGGCPNPDNSSRGNGKHSYSVEEEIGEDGQREGFVGVLDVLVHHAREIHNICIYDKQDVYAKLSFTSNPEGALSTHIANGGGRNPVFNESLQLRIDGQPDASLKCEVWMLSRLKNVMEDQLLGFALVPLATVVGKGKVTRDFALSSTDLFHSPAGIVQLTLSYHGSVPPDYRSLSIADATLSLSPSSISSDVGFLCSGMENPEPTNYNDIEFPDLQVASENHQMVSEYIKMTSSDLKPENSPKRDSMIADPNENEFSGAPFLHLGAFPSTEDDYDMAANTEGEQCSDSLTTIAKDTNSTDYQTNPVAEHSSPTVVSTTTSSSSEGPYPRDFVLRKDVSSVESTKLNGIESSSKTTLIDTDSLMNQEKLPSKDSDKEGAASSQPNISEGGQGLAFKTPLVSINLEPEQTVVQQQIVDMYMKSMQQFTESLAKMKLPMDVENEGSADSTKAGPDQKNVQSGKNAGSRVFYGSRAFF